MLIPIRCFTCNKLIANRWDEYQQKLKSKSPKEALDELRFTRICCRRMFITNVDVLETIL
jgi:DNA-directed RNA polymerase I, II, and III subunit RPABC5